MQHEAPAPYHHGRLREALLAASLELLASEGTDGLSLREVARRARVSKTAPYRHFADKQALLDAIAVEGFRHLTESVRESIDSAGPGALDRLQAQADAYARFALDRPAQFQIMFGRSKTEHSREPELGQAAEAAFGPCLEVIRQGQERGELAAGPPEEMATVVWALVHGVVMLVMSDHLVHREDTAGMTRLLRAAVIDLHRGMRSTAPPH